MEEITDLGFLFFPFLRFFLNRNRILVPVQVSYCCLPLIAQTGEKVTLVQRTRVCEIFLVIQYISNLGL